jgi:hypothetical protein
MPPARRGDLGAERAVGKTTEAKAVLAGRKALDKGRNPPGYGTKTNDDFRSFRSIGTNILQKTFVFFARKRSDMVNVKY